MHRRFSGLLQLNLQLFWLGWISLNQSVDSFSVSTRTALFTRPTKTIFSVKFLLSATVATNEKDEAAKDFLTTSSSSSSSSSSLSSTPTSSVSLSAQALAERMLETMSSLRQEAHQYAESFGLTQSEASFYAMFRALRETPIPLNLHGYAFVVRHEQFVQALQQDPGWIGFFTLADLEKAVDDDFLDAARGSTDHRKGWKITDVSQPRGNSFEEARMTFHDVSSALEKGTVIFNAAGAHIPKLAGPSLACTDGTMLPCALNLYVTAPGQRTSAPPHTDKQDVVVVQTSGCKHWRVYTPPTPSIKPTSDPFARGKGDDRLQLYTMEEMGCQLLLETVLRPGDALFIPAGFPHTTSTVVDNHVQSSSDGNDLTKDTSIHLTLGVDHHIWELDYLSARRLGLRRSGVRDTALGQIGDDDNPFVGKVNELPLPTWKDLLAELPLGLLDDDESVAQNVLEETALTLERISHEVDQVIASQVTNWRDVVIRFQQEGRELLEIHRDMYLAAIEEGRTREMEEAMTSHLAERSSRTVMTSERMQRLSLFRVKRFYDRINDSKASLKQWSYEGVPASSSDALPDNWAFTLPVKIGDEVEADLGGAFFSAKVTRASSGTYDVQFFDGDSEFGLERSQIKLLAPPASPVVTASDVDLSSMTPKQLKRWKKQQEQKKKRGQ